MLYMIKIGGRVDTIALLDFLDVTIKEDGDDTMLACRVQDAAALSGVVVLLHDAGLRVRELRAVPDVQTF